MCLGIFVLKTAQNLEQLRLVSSIHNENNKNDKRVLDIIISKKKSYMCEIKCYDKYFLEILCPRFNRGRQKSFLS